MKGWWVIAGLAAVAVLIVVLAPPMKISGDEILKTADAAPETVFFKSLYPSAVPTVQQMGCVPSFFETYVKDLSAPLMARNKDIPCSETNKSWLVSYSATGVIDTNDLYVGVDDKNGGHIIDTGFISPYDDIYVLNYTLPTTNAVMESVMKKGNYSVASGWASRTTDDGTKYLIYIMTSGNRTVLALYIEKAPEYKLATTDNLRSDITAAHAKYEAEGQRLDALIRGSFVGELNMTKSYLYYPEPKAA
jgi:hypothetical protein